MIKIWLSYDNLKIIAKLMKLMKPGPPFSIRVNSRKFSYWHISVKFLSILKKLGSFGKHFEWAARFPPQFFKSMKFLWSYMGFYTCYKIIQTIPVISIVNFQMAITQLNLGWFSKSLTFLKSSFNILQDSHIGSWIWLSLRGVMKGFSRVASYRRRICMKVIT